MLIGVSGWLFWRRDGWVALAAWALQLALNLGWTVVFFAAKNPEHALIEIVILWLAIAATIAAGWRVSRPGSVLLMPYLAWVTFAIALNAGIVILNSSTGIIPKLR